MFCLVMSLEYSASVTFLQLNDFVRTSFFLRLLCQKVDSKLLRTRQVGINLLVGTTYTRIKTFPIVPSKSVHNARYSEITSNYTLVLILKPYKIKRAQSKTIWPISGALSADPALMSRCFQVIQPNRKLVYFDLHVDRNGYCPNVQRAAKCQVVEFLNQRGACWPQNCFKSKSFQF